VASDEDVMGEAADVKVACANDCQWRVRCKKRNIDCLGMNTMLWRRQEQKMPLLFGEWMKSGMWDAGRRMAVSTVTCACRDSDSDSDRTVPVNAPATEGERRH